MRPGVAFGVVVASSGTGGLGWSGPNSSRIAPPKLFRAASTEEFAESSPRRVRQAHIDAVWGRLTGREWAILQDVARLRLVTSDQLERLHFAELASPSRAVVRRRVLARLVEWRVLATLPRRIGGVRAGSAGLVYAMDTAGWRLLGGDVRRRGVPGERYVRHVLDVSALCVALVERARAGDVSLASFATEPACWWPNGRGGTLKPDAYAMVSASGHQDHWWVEVDRATESLPTLRRKFQTYLGFVARGEQGPAHVIPRVLVTVPSAKRLSEVVRLISQLPSPADQLFIVTPYDDAISVIMRYLESV